MKKDNFIQIIKDIKNQFEINEEVYSYLTKAFEDFNGFCKMPIVDNLIKFLEKEFNDNIHWISFFIYELDFGKNYQKGTITIDNNYIKLKTIEDLYNLLINKPSYDN